MSMLKLNDKIPVIAVTLSGSVKRFIDCDRRIAVAFSLIVFFGTSDLFARLSDADEMKKAGWVNVKDADSTIKVKLIYSCADNFTGQIIYDNLEDAMLQPFAAKKLAAAQKELRKQYPGHSLVVFDAGRTRRAQQIMWDAVKGTPESKYVSSPKRISMHSYGVAVDVSIIDSNDNELDMGTPVDFLGPQAEPRREKEMLESGKLTLKQINNRNILRNVMQKAGFRRISNEWWHFEACTREEAEAKYKPVS